MIHALLYTGFKGMQIVTYLAKVKQLKSHWLKVPQKGLGTCIWINKSFSPFWLCSMRGIQIAKVEGLWLVNRPRHSVSEDPDDSPKVWLCSPFIVPSLNSTRDPCDIMKWCHNHLLWFSSGKTTVHAHWKHCHSSVHLLASTPESLNTINATKPICLFLNPISMPVTYMHVDLTCFTGEMNQIHYLNHINLIVPLESYP